MASVAPEVVVSGTVVAAPPGGVVVGTVVGATGHPALPSLLVRRDAARWRSARDHEQLF